MSEELFHNQLVNSYIHHVAKTPFEQFMVRTVLMEKTQALTRSMGPRAMQFANATTQIFFGGDSRAYAAVFKEDLPTNPHHIYRLETFPYGSTTIRALSD